MKVMKVLIFFLILPLFFISCKGQEQEEEIVDLDSMVMGESELDPSHLAGEPLPSPHESLIKESPALE